MVMTVIFESINDECEYWKKLYHRECTKLKQDYDHYMMKTEMTFQSLQNVIDDLSLKLTECAKENEMWKLKIQKQNNNCADLEELLDYWKRHYGFSEISMCLLQRQNDDLQYAQSKLKENIVEIENKMEKTLKSNAFLELEVAILQAQLQRIKTEYKDVIKLEVPTKSTTAKNNEQKFKCLKLLNTEAKNNRIASNVGKTAVKGDSQHFNKSKINNFYQKSVNQNQNQPNGVCKTWQPQLKRRCQTGQPVGLRA